MKRIFKFVLFGIFVQVTAVSGRGIRSDKDQLYMEDAFGDVSPGGETGEVPIGSNLLFEKVKPGNDPVDTTHHAVDQESIGNDKRRKFVNGRSNPFQTVNVSVEYMPDQENGTWNVEKKEKSLDLGKEIIKTHTGACQVTTEELIATAQETVTKALKGLCNSKEMDERLEDLERGITMQLNSIKSMILNLEDKLGEHGDVVMYGQKQLSTAISKGCSGTYNGNGAPSTIDVTYKNQKSPHDYNTPKLPPSINGNNGHVDTSEEESEVSGTRDLEILKFNSSIHMETSLNGPPRKVFTYYWKIKDMASKMTGWNPRKSFRSQSFYIFPSGYRMYLRVFPRQNDDNFYVRVGVTKGEFDDTLKWPFPLKHKIHILDQTKEGRLFEDIASRIRDPNVLCSDFHWQKPVEGDNHECGEIGFPHDILRQREYIRKDALVIKLTVYLES